MSEGASISSPAITIIATNLVLSPLHLIWDSSEFPVPFFFGVQVLEMHLPTSFFTVFLGTQRWVGKDAVSQLHASVFYVIKADEESSSLYLFSVSVLDNTSSVKKGHDK